MSDGTVPDPAAILFVCGRNAIRSPMAEALLDHCFPGAFFARSAGVVPGERDPFVDAVLAEIGVDIGKHRPHGFDDLEDLSFDLAITLSPEAHHRTLELTRTQALEIEYWLTPDPFIVSGSREQILTAYRDVRERLLKRLDTRFSAMAARRAGRRLSAAPQISPGAGIVHRPAPIR